jgi:hypothetical protein
VVAAINSSTEVWLNPRSLISLAAASTMAVRLSLTMGY